MDVQTQVIDQSSLTEQDVAVQARVSDFKESLREIRAIRVGIVEKMRELVGAIQTQAYARDNVIGMFRSEAMKMHPELVVKDVWEFAQTSSSSFQLHQLYKIYQARLDGILSKMALIEAQFAQMKSKEERLAQEEAQILKLYADFAASVPGAPAPEVLQAELQKLDVIPQVEEGNVQVTALEELPMETADMITAQAVAMETGYDREAVNRALERSMYEPSQDKSGELEALQNLVSQPVSGVKIWHLLLGGAAILYLLS